jgi:hypothetical protein
MNINEIEVQEFDEEYLKKNYYIKFIIEEKEFDIYLQDNGKIKLEKELEFIIKNLKNFNELIVILIKKNDDKENNKNDKKNDKKNEKKIEENNKKIDEINKKIDDDKKNNENNIEIIIDEEKIINENDKIISCEITIDITNLYIKKSNSKN